MCLLVFSVLISVFSLSIIMPQFPYFYELPDLIILNKELTLLFLIAALQADTTCVLYLPTENRTRK